MGEFWVAFGAASAHVIFSSFAAEIAVLSNAVTDGAMDKFVVGLSVFVILLGVDVVSRGISSVGSLGNAD